MACISEESMTGATFAAHPSPAELAWELGGLRWVG